MDIEAPTFKLEDGWFFASSKFSIAGEIKTLWFSAPEVYAEHFIPNRLDAFLVGLLPVAMEHGENIRVRGDVSEKLLYNINSYLIPVLHKSNFIYKKISISADQTCSEKIEKLSSGGATGFSGGIDSFCTIAEHMSLPETSSYQLKHLLFNNVGAISSNVFIEKFDALKSIEKHINLDLIPINSNLGSLVGIPFVLSHSLRNSACALFLQSLIKNYYYASAFTYDNINTKNISDIASLDPVILHLLSTENIEIVASGAQHSRVEKTSIVSDFSISKCMLNVCVAPNRISNCSVCWKCCRTLLTLELLGKIQEYKNAFDLSKWQKARFWFISEYVLNPKKTNDPFTVEIRILAKEKNHHFSLIEKLFAQVAAWTPQAFWNRIKNN